MTYRGKLLLVLLCLCVGVIQNGCNKGKNRKEQLVDGSGAPAIAFTYVPKIGSRDNLKGMVSHVMASQHKVAVFIQVDGGWWTKPYDYEPYVSIGSDGAFTCDITTGGKDEQAFKIRALLIPADAPLIAVLGPKEIPENVMAMYQKVAEVEADRTNFDEYEKVWGFEPVWATVVSQDENGNLVQEYELGFVVNHDIIDEIPEYLLAVWKDGVLNPSLGAGYGTLEPNIETCVQLVILQENGPALVTDRICIGTNSATNIPPSAPTQLVAVLDNSTVHLSWNDNSSNEDSFGVEVRIDGGNWLAKDTFSPNTTAYTDTGITANHEYCYRVYAKNAFAVSDFTNVDCVTTSTETLLPPTGLTVIQDVYFATLSWKDNSKAFTSIGFVIQRSNNGGAWNEIARVNAGTTTYREEDKGVFLGGDYCYKVAAIALDGSFSAFTNSVCMSVQPAMKSIINGLDFGPYVKPGQNPDWGSRPSKEQIIQLLVKLKPLTQWIRVYGSSSVLMETIQLAKARGFLTIASAWIGKAPLTDPGVNDREIDNLIQLCNEGVVNAVCVGNEVLLRGDQTPNVLISMIQRVKRSIPASVMVTTSETYGKLIESPQVMDACDFIFFNSYPFWEGIHINDAMCHFVQTYEQLKLASKGRPMVVSETGWPSAGSARGEAIPSPDNAARYFIEFTSWARKNDVSYCYFEAFDEPWKTAEPSGVGTHWGIMDSDGNMKPGMMRVFNNETVALNCPEPICPPGNPSLSFTSIPDCGGSILKGAACNVSPQDYRVTVFIRVGTGWWGAKPTWASPLTAILPNGSWECNINTGGNDGSANAIKAFVVPKDYDPPDLAGVASIPTVLSQTAVAVAEATRNCK